MGGSSSQPVQQESNNNNNNIVEIEENNVTKTEILTYICGILLLGIILHYAYKRLRSSIVKEVINATETV